MGNNTSQLKLQRNQLLGGRPKRKIFVIEDAVMERIKRHSELYTNPEATFGVLYKLPQVQEMSHEPLKCHCINLYLQLDSDLGETDL